MHTHTHTHMYTYHTHRAVEYMVRSHPEHVDVRDNLQCTPLHIAASEGEVEVAKTLLDVVYLYNTHNRYNTGNTVKYGMFGAPLILANLVHRCNFFAKIKWTPTGLCVCNRLCELIVNSGT